jgi:NTE family protein
MFNRLAELKRALSPPDIYISPRVDQFGSADFFRVREILAAAEPAKDELKSKLQRMAAAQTLPQQAD